MLGTFTIENDTRIVYYRIIADDSPTTRTKTNCHKIAARTNTVSLITLIPNTTIVNNNIYVVISATGIYKHNLERIPGPFGLVGTKSRHIHPRSSKCWTSLKSSTSPIVEISMTKCRSTSSSPC